MTRNDIAVALWAEGLAPLTKVQAEEVTKFVLGQITATLEKGEDVNVTGLGTFKCKVREARKGRNPKTGEAMNFPAMTVVKFKLSKTVEKAPVKVVRGKA